MKVAPRPGGTRDRLLQAAEKEFARYGYAGAHLQSIAEQVGVQKTALYYYFDSKSDLYTAVIEAMLEVFERSLGAALASEGSHPERLERVLDVLNDLLAERPSYASILTRIFIDAGEADFEAIGPSIRRLIGGLMAFYRQGVDAGAFRRLSARHVFQSMFGMTLFHYAAPLFSAGVLEVDDVYAPEAVRWRREQVRRLILRGVLPDGPAAA